MFPFFHNYPIVVSTPYSLEPRFPSTPPLFPMDGDPHAHTPFILKHF